MRKRRKGPDTCCYRCARDTTCRNAPSKTRSPCTYGPPDTGSCHNAQQGRHPVCTVCPLWRRTMADHPDQARMFSDGA